MSDERVEKDNDGKQSRIVQLSLLMWKNMIIRKHHWILTLFELGVPTALMCLVVFVRAIPDSKLKPTDHPETSYYSTGSERLLRSDLCIKSLGYWVLDRCVYSDAGLPGDRKLFWGPPTPFAAEMISIIQKEIFFDDMHLENATTISEMDDLVDAAYLTSNTSINAFYIGIFFNLDDDGDQPPVSLNYDLRLQKIWYTEEVYPYFQVPGPRNYSVYSASYALDGFAIMQTIVDRAYMRILSNYDADIDKLSLQTQMYPYPPYIQDHGMSQVYSSLLPTFIVFSLVLLSPTLIKSIVYEKETGVRELIRMMGLEGWLIWVGWFLYSFTTIFIICIVMSALLKTEVKSHDGNSETILTAVLVYSSWSLLFFFFILYGISSIVFCFAVSCFFSRPTLATTIGVFLWLLSFFIPQALLNNDYENATLTAKLTSCLMPNNAMALGFNVIGMMEGRAIGVHWNNLWEVGNPRDQLTLGMVLLMLILDIFIFILITWYVDQVLPGTYGVPKPWYFIFQKSYWCSSKVKSDVEDIVLQNSSSQQTSIHYEPEPTGMVAGIKIRGLRKEFKTLKNKVKVAVENVDLTCFKGQCTVLLGHNGAGKTTTMSVLTGVYAPTSGYAEVNGWNINTHLKEARAQVGLCPQHNTLFTDLSVKQHLLFFARLKGLDMSSAKKEAKIFLKRLQLEDKKDMYGGELSGGMKRKLCLAIALIGGSKVIILDEPSSGLDPESRRWVWDVVQQERGDRTVLVTTHHMEEADVLGDRVAIMASGRIVCCGSSLFLKNTFGDGYTLSITGQNETDIELLKDAVYNHFNEAELRAVEGFCYDFKLPPQTDKFADLLDSLTKQKSALKIDHLGLSLTSMEQVFLRVGELEEKRTKENGQKATSESVFLNQSFDSNSDLDLTQRTVSDDEENCIENNSISAVPQGAYRELKLSGKRLQFQRFRSLCLKKFIYSKRKWLLLFTQALIPVLVSYLCLSVDSSFDEQDFKEPPIELSLDMFEYSYSSVYYNTNVSEMVADNFMDLFYDPYKVSVSDNITTDLLDVANTDLNTYRENYVTSAEFTEGASKLFTKVMYQSIPFHTTGIGVNLIDNALLHTLINDSFSITTNNAPLPVNKAWQMDDTQTTYSSTLYSMMMPLALAFLTSSFLVFPLQERVSNAKQIQLMTGTSPFLLWLTAFVWDMLTYILTAILIFIFFMAFDSKGYFTEDGARGALFLLLFLYGIASVPMAYVFSFLFHSGASGFALLALINIIAGMIVSSVTLVLRASESANLIHISNIIGNITAFIPSYPASKGFMSIVDMTNYNRFCDVVAPSQVESLCKTIEDYSINSSFVRCCPQCEDYGDCFQKMEYLQWQYPGLGMHLMYLFVDCIFYFIILYLLEIGLKDLLSFQMWKYIRKFSPVDVKEAEELVDDDVQREKLIVDELIKKPNVDGTAIIVQDLRKIFSKSGVVAVKGISFLVKKGECFGLLGVNGAGKTTTFRMLTGDEIRSSGDARIGFNYLSHGRKKFMEEIGYCPQFDAIIGELTGIEMLSLMAGLRGVEKRRQSELIKRLVNLVDLTECAKRPSSTYSGGNKRKLSTAMAMIGQPPIVFLDEPTSGVDPASRRRVWEAVRDATNCGQSVILTSHSMDECEALCSRLVIMAKGVLKCSGTPKHLKAKFGSGRVLQVKIKSNLPSELVRMSISKDNESNYQERVEELKDVLSCCFKSATLTDEHRGMLVYKIPSSHSWSEIFGTMEALKSGKNIPKGIYQPTNGVKATSHLKHLIEDYAATDSSLEQVFLSFAREGNQSQSDKTQSPSYNKYGNRRGSYSLS